MKILLSNDDGYQATGLAVVARALATIAEVTVVAPQKNCSGASNSLTLRKSLRVQQHSNGFHSVAGTPVDCVHLAITGMLDFQPDMVIAGINHGANLGDDVLYSGTVAAAIEGRFLGLPAIAISLAGEPLEHFQTAADVLLQILNNLSVNPLPQDTILNVNVPELPLNQLCGIQATRLGARHQSQPVIKETSPNKKSKQRIYRIGTIGDGADAGEGTDFHAIDAGMVSVTPLQIDMTRHRSLENIADWLSNIQLTS